MTYKRLTTSCLDCKKEISSNNFSKHQDSKSCTPAIIKKCNECIFCNITFEKLHKHEPYCTLNPNRISRSGTNQYTKAKETGVPYIIKDETRQKLSDTGTGRKHTEESLAKIRKCMQRAVKENPDSYAGGYNRGRVKSLICSNGFNVLGGWEQTFVEFCLSNNIQIQQPNTGFSYEWNGSRTYFPDFYLPESNMWIEVKGYETERDKAKWESMINVHKKNLNIVKSKEIKNLNEWWEQPELN